jgi:hypothetical protein
MQLAAFPSMTRSTTLPSTPGASLRNTIAILAAAAATLALAPAAAIAKPAATAGSDAVSVCNEAENSPRGGYVVTGGPVDPNPPAFLRGSQMRVGNGHGAGLVGAAERSPALRLCGPQDDGGSDDGGWIAT